MKNIKKSQSFSNGVAFYSNKTDNVYVTTYSKNSINHVTLDVQVYSAIHKSIIKTALPTYICIFTCFWFFLVIVNIFLLTGMQLKSCIAFDITFMFGYKHFIRLFSSCIFYDINAKRFHASEHMAINAYRTLQRVPSLKELRTFSKFSNYCGCLYTIQNCVFYLMLFAIVTFSNDIFMFTILWVINYIICFLPPLNRWIKYFEILIAFSPTNRELLLTIEALKYFDELESR